jgi:hypothetical protein
LADSIETRYVKGGYATADEIVLSETPKTRTVFRPGIHPKGVRGEIIRQKKGVDGSWASTNEVNFTTVPPDCGVAIELDTEATAKLLDKLTKLQEVQRKGVAFGSTKFVVGKEDEVLLVNDSTKSRVMKELLEQGYSEEFWTALAEKEPDLASRLAVAKLHLDRCAIIEEFEASLQTYRSDEAYWQRLFEMSQAGFDGDPETRIPTWKKGTPKPCHDRRNTPMSCSIAVPGWSPTPAGPSPT